MRIKFKRIILIFLSFLPLIISIASLRFLPDLIPAHYGLNGEVTRWGSKYEVLLMPIIGLIVCIISILYTNYEMKKIQNNKNIESLDMINIIFIFTFNVLTIIFLISDFNKLSNINNSFSMKLLCVSIGLILILIGKCISKCKRNSFIGIRTSLTLSSDDVWSETHKFGGKVFGVFGIIISIISLFIPSDIVIVILIISMIIIIITLTIYPRKILDKFK